MSPSRTRLGMLNPIRPRRKNRPSPSHPSRGEVGQSLVELAVSLVLLLIVVAGVVEVGRIGFHYITMHDAAQEGAAYASIYPNSCAAIENRVRANISEIDNPRIAVSILIGGQPCQSCTACKATNSCPVAGHIVKVTVTDPAFPITMPFLSTFLGRSTIQLNATIEETVIRPECE
ncbi:MAG: TadE/TadG family type IV pilus assembly protein [Thermanaerothrix sp.]|uniref:TadE/TadG family type IV pilus assembly protein n=1 Tax=Thermanaerothrix sp. TaxID=2972675 RepID=UPI003C7A96CB